MPIIKDSITKLKSIFNLGQAEELAPEGVDSRYRSLSDKELRNILNDVYVADQSNRQVVDKMQIPGILEPIGSELISRRVDYEKLMELAPEVRQASAILTSSILSPNDFKKTDFTVQLDLDELDDSVRTKITDLVSDHFGETLGITKKLTMWLDDALFRAGSKVVMVFPTNSLDSIRSSISNTPSGNQDIAGSLESVVVNFRRELGAAMEDLNGVSLKVSDQMRKDDTLVDRIIGAVGRHTSIGEKFEPKRIRQTFSTTLPKSLEFLDTRNMLKFTTDPRCMFSSRFENASAMEKLDRQVLSKLDVNPDITHKMMDRSDGVSQVGPGTPDAAQYDYVPYIDLSNYINDDKPSDFPAMIELPPESVVPIIVEGSPSTHLGYFILLNEQGNPISADRDDMTYDNVSDSATGSQRIDRLYDAMHGGQMYSLSKQMTSDAKLDIMNSVYDSYIKSMLTSKLNNFGFDGFQVGMSNDITRMMLFRMMRNSETRVLFVPKRLVHYLAFEYHRDGTGKSKLDAIKFPLSMKITFIIVRLISLIESSINRRKLNITLDDTVGNPLEVLRTVKKELMKNKMYGITYDPTTIMRGILDKELTIVPDRIPGVESFALTEENNSVDYPRPDDGVLDEINNMYMMSLGVPPSALNRLSEDEFSRSVASTNLFFSNQLKEDQGVFCAFMSEFIQNYVRFSKKLRTGISEALKGVGSGSSGGKAEGGEKNLNVKIDQVIQALKFTLPSPALAQDKSAFEELREYIEIIESVLNAIFPPELTNDSELADTIGVLRANLKHEMLLDHISTNSILSDLKFNALEDMDLVGIMQRIQKIRNLKKGLDDGQTTLSGEGAEEGDEESGGSAW